jgi:hypothetical protein
MNLFFVIFKIGFEFYTYCVVRTKNSTGVHYFQDFSAGLANKIRTLTKITTLLGTFGQGLSISPKKDPHPGSNDFDAISF